MEPMKASSVLSLLETNPPQRATFISDLLNSIESGETDVNTVRKQIENIETLFRDIKANIQ